MTGSSVLCDPARLWLFETLHETSPDHFSKSEELAHAANPFGDMTNYIYTKHKLIRDVHGHDNTSVADLRGPGGLGPL